MSAARHTPGPWEAAGHCIRSPFAHGDPEKRGFLVAECCFGSMPAEANARLIAAAPDLLATLTQLCFVIRTGGDVLAACEGAEAVIARAMGEVSHG